MSVTNNTPFAEIANVEENAKNGFMDEATVMQGEVVHIAARLCQKHQGKLLLCTTSVLGSFHALHNTYM